MKREYHLIKNIVKKDTQFWPSPSEILFRGSYDEAIAHAKKENFKSFDIVKMKFDGLTFVED